ncbi:glycosyltransferase [Patescibacteria group bacterium]|nr:glycosyltransferase [Patescibacteria group bacterium]MDL1952874.1 glycosyltransferase [Candidatus Uhrbacteria bacterium UHB]RIL01108.1 MAG: hypothetical protein DCC77_01030 [Candidatus Uhrbacteria bacterium]
MNNAPLVLHVIPTLRRGGAERLALELCARLPAYGYRTKLAGLFGGGSLWGEMRDRNIRWIELASSTHAHRAALLRRLLRVIYADPPRRPAIVHTHLFGGDVWSIAAKSIHRVGWGAIFDASSRMKPFFISTAHNIDRDDTSARRAARRWAVRRMHRVIAISKDVGHYAERDLGAAPSRVQVIPNGIDVDAIPLRRGIAAPHTPRFFMTGRLEPQKGHAILFRALADVPPPWTLDIAGTGSLERDLKELAERLGISSRIRFLGERDDIPALLGTVDVFLFPSQWEGMGLALLEAMAAGVPALASDLPSIREYAPASMLVAAHEPSAWTAAIMRVMADPVLAAEVAMERSTAIRARYTIDRMVRAYAAVYDDILSNA